MNDLTITDFDGNTQKVTDLKKAIEQARNFAAYEPRPDYEYEVKAQIYWKDVLVKLEKLGEQYPELLK